jgi:hypothetical protein
VQVRALVSPVPGASAQPDALLAATGGGAVETIPAGLDAGLRHLATALDAGHRTVLMGADVVASTASLGRLVDDLSTGTALLVAPAGGAGGASTPVRVHHHVVASAGSAHHAVAGATARSLGALVVRAEDCPSAAAAVREMAEVVEAQGWDGDVVDHAVVALVRREVGVRAVEAVGPATRSSDAAQREEAARRLAAGDDERAARESGNRSDDGFYSTFVLRRLSKPLTGLAIRVGLSPNAVSLLSLAVGLLAAVLFAVGSLPATLAAAVLLQVSIVVDCVDGEVARRTRRFSALGAWLDASTDRVKEFAVYAGLAAGYAGSGSIWLLAGAVLVMQTVRHMSDYDFARVLLARETWVAPRPLDDPSDGGQASAGAALDLSRRASGNPAVYWAKKAIHMPIGERWLVISVGSVLVGPWWTLVALLALGLVAIAYTLLGRLLRVRRWDHPAQRSGRWLLVPQLDLGPLAAPLLSRAESRRPVLAGPLGWAVPALLRLAELGLVLAAAAVLVPEQLTWAYALLFVLAFHHYDTLYRALGGEAPPRWLVWVGLGVEGRILVVLVAVLLGPAALSAVLVVGTVLLAGWFVVVASAQYVIGMRRAA